MSNVHSNAGSAAVPERLRVEWALVAGSFLLLTVAVAGLARSTRGSQIGLAGVSDRIVLAWTGGTLAIGAFELWFLHGRLHRNRRPDSDTPADTLGVANALTLVRGWLLAAVGGFAFVEPTSAIGWFPAVAYSASAAFDRLDGTLARTIGRRTELGVRLDLAFDTLGFLIAPIVAVVWGRLPVWYLTLSAVRYLFRAGVATRHLRAKPVYPLPSSAVRRPLAGMQMAFIGLALAPLLPFETIQLLAVIALPLSLSIFLRDYLAVAGHLQPAKG